MTLSISDESITSRFVGVFAGVRFMPMVARTVLVGQELDIQDLQQQLLARDSDFEELQQQWNLQNFKFCLLVDMVRVCQVSQVKYLTFAVRSTLLRSLSQMH